MKKSIFFIPVLASVMLASCAQNTSKQSDNQPKDSIEIDSIETSNNQVQEQSTQTPDQKFFFVKGPVATIFYNTYNRVDFDAKGNLVASNLMDVNMEEYVEGTYDYITSVKRDSLGRIKQYLKTGDPYQMEYKDNLLVRATSVGVEDYIYEYEYNQDNLPIKRNSFMVDYEEKTPNGSQTINYTKFDACGNWTECEVSDGKYSRIEKRYIVYYADDNLLPDGYGSADESFFECSGPVKKIVEKYKTLEFNRKGELILLDGKNPFEARPEQWSENDIVHYTKDNQGKIIKWESPYSFGECIWDDGQLRYTISFEEGGVVVQIEYFYDSVNSQAKKYRNRECDYDEYENNKYIFGSKHCTDEDITDIKLDSHGNWISRKVGEQIQERTIEYWQ